jgi:hypothetical protein
MKNDVLAHERNLARDRGEQAVADERHWSGLADALRRAGAEVMVGRLKDNQGADKVTHVRGLNIEHLVRLRSRPSRASLGDRPLQWQYRFLVGAPTGGPIESFFVSSEGSFDYARIAERLLWLVEDEIRKKAEREELRALRKSI